MGDNIRLWRFDFNLQFRLRFLPLISRCVHFLLLADIRHPVLSKLIETFRVLFYFTHLDSEKQHHVFANSSSNDGLTNGLAKSNSLSRSSFAAEDASISSTQPVRSQHPSVQPARRQQRCFLTSVAFSPLSPCQHLHEGQLGC